MYVETYIKQMTMIKTSRRIMTGALILFVMACKNAPDSAIAEIGDAKEVATANAAETLPIDVIASKLEWIGTKLSTYHSGTVNIKSGEMRVADGKLAGGQFVMDMPTLVTTSMDAAGNKKLTGHLMSPDFFDVVKYPEAKFEITSVVPFSGKSAIAVDTMKEISKYAVADPNVTISGNLTIKDITKNISFPAKITVNKSDVYAVAKFNIDRKQWNLVYPGMPDDLIQDLIWFGISIKANSIADNALK